MYWENPGFIPTVIHSCQWCYQECHQAKLISVPSYKSLLSTIDSVCLSVCHTRSNCFFFVSPWNRAIFWPSVLHMALYKTLFFDFWFSPPNAQNLLPKICTKSPISRLVWQIDRRCLGLLGGFWGWPIQWNHAKCCGADPCCHGNEIWPRRRDLVAYRLVYVKVNTARITVNGRPTN